VKETAMAENGTTKVRFDLWAVLAVIVIFFFGGFSYLNTYLVEGRAARISNDHAMAVRITKLEASFDYITCGITELKAGQKELVETMKAHEKMNGYKR
jgi:hypothetical protein